jgi:alkylation response protein AidB-like acyl-CoA dehydrogenase
LLWRPEQLQGLHVAGSAFAMTEPEVASSDAGNISTSILRDGDDYVVNGNTWWISGAADERCTVFIVMGKTDPGPDHRATPADLRLPGPARALRAGVSTTFACPPPTCWPALGMAS